mmetsp:Transcript_123277/g.356184  ORF Transcript_123277/g.356184 Transcript_123277/m.356184 type:complete len:348 (+) Transcript_123277:1483-2526(+)
MCLAMRTRFASLAAAVSSPPSSKPMQMTAVCGAVADRRGGLGGADCAASAPPAQLCLSRGGRSVDGAAAMEGASLSPASEGGCWGPVPMDADFVSSSLRTSASRLSSTDVARDRGSAVELSAAPASPERRVASPTLSSTSLPSRALASGSGTGDDLPVDGRRDGTSCNSALETPKGCALRSPSFAPAKGRAAPAPASAAWHWPSTISSCESPEAEGRRDGESSPGAHLGLAPAPASAPGAADPPLPPPRQSCCAAARSACAAAAVTGGAKAPPSTKAEELSKTLGDDDPEGKASSAPPSVVLPRPCSSFQRKAISSRASASRDRNSSTSSFWPRDWKPKSAKQRRKS